MKSIKVMMLAGLLALSTPAFAQFTTGGSSNSGGFSSTENTPYNVLSVGYTYNNMSVDQKGAEDTSLNGFNINYLHGFSLSSTLPMYLEAGLRFSMGFNSESNGDDYDYDDDDYYRARTRAYDYDYDYDYDDYYGEDCDMSKMLASIAVPVNFAWRFRLGENLYVKPYAGLDFKLHIIGRTKYTFGDESETANWFDKKDMGGKDYTFNRFQVGWHVGASLQYSKFIIGLDYGTDFNEIAKKTNTSTLNVNVGFCF